jgi:NAD(P)-dependent dehydrogenase (short-subunit alcohol dehydrogenase family)
VRVLLRAGHKVYATARRPESLTTLAAAGAEVLPLDVTSEDSMRAAVDAVVDRHGAVGALVNNAGYGEYGTVEETDLHRVRTMFETNVFGLARLTQLVLPGMRAAGAGRVVNMSSMGGRFTWPVGGYYHASKYAVESLSDALRAEVRPFGIGVSVVEPGLIRTGFERTALSSQAALVDDRSPYAGLLARAATAASGSYGNPLLAAGPEPVARVVRRAIESPHPRPRYVVTPAARLLVHTRRLGGDRVWDAIVRSQFGS